MSEKECNEVKKMIIKVKTFSQEDELEILTKIHNQLVGNEDYIESRILLNSSKDRKAMNPETFNSDEENELHVYFFGDCKTNPKITI